MSRRLFNCAGDSRAPLFALSSRNSPIYSPRVFLRRLWHLGDQLFKRERCIFRCDDILLGMYLCRKPSHYLKQSPLYNQVLTGVLPYHGSNAEDMIIDIRAGKRPSRPISPRNRWSHRRIWGVITTGWSHKPEKRCELSAIHHAFSTTSQQEQGDLKI